ncbi:acyltransferase [Enterovibrio makurazakiensis]|uniref:Acyltransferase n=1 Tax=Enterovibrio gelatinilyticus TaxID=2899819 RepID=A0ABT5R018_9GAMM|nr:acyltransferase [Enterovibrio sp. ZSDZ42]MDD1793603.1 acyltransferase [Enterovibrio sp. ZSDZ42]
MVVSYIKRSPNVNTSRQGGLLNRLLFTLRNKVKVKNGNTINVASATRIRQCHISIKGTGNKLMIDDGANLKGVHIEINGNNCSLTVGKHSVIGEGCYLSARENGTTLTIGENCMFSRNVKVMTSDGHDILCANERINPAKSITIGSHVWLADGAVVLKGNDIGDHSVVGINAVVTHDVPTNSIAAGNPAKIIKSDICWDEKLTY